MTEIYCLRCKSKTPTTDVTEAMSKNGRKMLRGKCSVCGTKKSVFVKK